MRVSGKRALVTGGASGIGAATAERFAAEGAAVAIADLDGPGTDRQVAAIHAHGGQAIGLVADVGDEASVTAMMDRAWEALGGVDILVNNAAIPMIGTVETLAGDDWDRVLDLDLSSIYRVSRAAWPRFVEAGGGTILNTASVAGVIGMAGQHGYSAAKAGVVMLTKCMALDGAAHGIRANCVCPGFVETPMANAYFDAQDDPEASKAAVNAAHPLGRMGQPDEIAAAFLYLASDEARWVTGTALVIDGGLTAGLPPG
ncbi:MAG: SDR family NAD(P)-dependent oxidoreductase [Rhodospirillales bacterium]|nr:SDR family NAD(P)-dependent oxidoreductase [Rhodospirillales bacterium]